MTMSDDGQGMHRVLDYIQARARRQEPGSSVHEELVHILRTLAPAEAFGPEPPIGATVRTQYPSGDLLHYVRDREGWRIDADPDNPPFDWLYVSSLPGVTRLVPDPAADLVELPWAAPSNRYDTPALIVDRGPQDGSVLRVAGVGLAQDDIRRLGAICAAMLRPGAERDQLLAATERRADDARTGKAPA